MKPVEGFDRNVFVNCPFDDDYRQLLLSIAFTVCYLGYKPRLSLERADSSEVRIEKIVSLIEESRFGIHDLSRIVSTEADQHVRMNMPFELGIDFGCKRLKSGKWSGKRILVLEKEQYRYHKALSDLSGSDIKSHNDEPRKAISAVRDWFVTNEGYRKPSGNVIWNDYNDFQAFLYDELVVKDGHDDVDDIQESEIIMLMESWVASRLSTLVAGNG